MKFILPTFVLAFALLASGCSLMTNTVILDPAMVDALKAEGATNVSCDKEIALKENETGKCDYSMAGFDYTRTLKIGKDDDYNSIYVNEFTMSAQGEKVTLNFKQNGDLVKCNADVQTSDEQTVCSSFKEQFPTGMDAINQQLRDSLKESMK